MCSLSRCNCRASESNLMSSNVGNSSILQDLIRQERSETNSVAEEQICAIAGTPWSFVQLCKMNAGNAQCGERIDSYSELRTTNAPRYGKEMARPYTKLAPAAETGHQNCDRSGQF